MTARTTGALAFLLSASIAGGACVNEAASLAENAPICPEGLSACAGRCVDTQLDREHCGACEAPCPAQHVCSLGGCGLDCVGGTMRCGDACVDFLVDPQNCGDCGTTCPSGTCSQGVCPCSNAIVDPAESDVDCGGPCTPCPEGKGCGDDDDCVSGTRCIGGVCTVPLPPLDDALVGLWRFEGDGSDQSTHQNDAVVVNASPTAGKLGGAYLFGEGACLVVPDAPSLDMTGGSSLTMMAWIRYEAPCGDDRGLILNKEDAYELGVECTMALLQDAIQFEGVGWTWNGQGAVTAGSWQHVAAAWDGATVRHYVDGIEVYSHALAGVLPDRATGLGIGCREVAADGDASAIRSFFRGALDEVAIYSRALSTAEIQTYHAEAK